MAEDIAQNVDEVESSLNEILPAVDVGTVQFETANKSLTAALAQLREQDAIVRGGLRELVTNVQLQCEEATACHTHTEEMVRLVTDSAVETCEHAKQVVDSFNDLQEEVRLAMSAAIAEVRQAVTTHRERADDLINMADEFATASSTTGNQLLSGVNDFLKSVEQSWSQMELNHDEVSELVLQRTEVLRGEITDAYRAAYADFTGQVEATLLNDTQDGLTAIAGSVRELTENSKVELESLAEGLRNRLTETLEKMGDHAANEIETNLKASFDNLIDSCLSAFLGELTESVALTQVGVATSGTLMPVLPELIAVNALLSTVNKIL